MKIISLQRYVFVKCLKHFNYKNRKILTESVKTFQRSAYLTKKMRRIIINTKINNIKEKKITSSSKSSII